MHCRVRVFTRRSRPCAATGRGCTARHGGGRSAGRGEAQGGCRQALPWRARPVNKRVSACSSTLQSRGSIGLPAPLPILFPATSQAAVSRRGAGLPDASVRSVTGPYCSARGSASPAPAWRREMAWAWAVTSAGMYWSMQSTVSALGWVQARQRGRATTFEAEADWRRRAGCLADGTSGVAGGVVAGVICCSRPSPPSRHPVSGRPPGPPLPHPHPHPPATSKYCPLPPMTSTHDTPRCAASAGSLAMNGVMGSRAPETSSCAHVGQGQGRTNQCGAGLGRRRVVPVG